MTMAWWQHFLVPDLRRGTFWVRLFLVAVGAWLFFGHVCMPTWIRGRSMEPTYRDGTFTFCWCPRYWFREPRVGEVVTVRLGGPRVMYLKRVVAVAGETVEFRHGRLWVNGKERAEPYLAPERRCDWDLPPRMVKPVHVYVVGDNRAVPMDEHLFGQTETSRVVGGPLW
jgi:signal peptidase I